MAISSPPPVQAPEAFVVGPLEVRPAELEVLAGGRRVGFTVREFEVFLELARRPDRVVQRADLYDLVWGAPMAYRDRSVDVFVRKVRRKLAAAAPEWTFVHTHFGVGYRLAPERIAP
jgi:DNA-binding response OmpR family regulator